MYFFFSLTECCNFFSEYLDFYKGALSMGDCPNQLPPGAPRLWLKGDRASWQALGSSTAHREVCMPDNQCVAGQDSSCVPSRTNSARSHKPHRSTFVCGWMTVLLFKGEKQKMRDILSTIMLTSFFQEDSNWEICAFLDLRGSYIGVWP